MQVKKQQLELDMEQQTGSKLGKEYIRLYIVTLLIDLYAEYIMRNTGLEEAQAGIKIAGRNINNLRYLFEGNPVGEGTTRRGTATPVHRPQRFPASSVLARAGAGCGSRQGCLHRKQERS